MGKKRICFDEEKGDDDASQPKWDQEVVDTAASKSLHNENVEAIEPPAPKAEAMKVDAFDHERPHEPEAEAMDEEPLKESESPKPNVVNSPSPRKDVTKGKGIKSRKSKVLFSGMDSMLMDGGSGVDEQQPRKGLKEIGPVSYDDIHGKQKFGNSAPNSAHKASSAKKPVSSVSPKKVSPTVAKVKPRRSYQRRKTTSTPKTKARKTLDPFHLSITPQPKKAPKSTKKSTQKKKPAPRSKKIFSDDSVVDSVKRTPEKTFSPYTLKVQDAGDKSLDTTFKPEKATREQRVTRNKVLKFLEHVSGLLSAAAEFEDRVSRSVLRDIAFYIEEKTDDLVR